jgi:aspartyl-tRNA synthetase
LTEDATLHTTCGELNAAHDGRTAIVQGWVNSARDHGDLVFIDVRDRFGVTQTVFDPSVSAEAAALAKTLRSEDVIRVEGRVRRRPAGTENHKIATGEIELAATHVHILNRSLTPPFPIHGDGDVDETLRMKYRYLDLRRPHMQRNIALRHRALKTVRDYLDERGFLEIETPMLIKQTPEGARDFLVPSRLHPGEFYALPQSPQLFKQILMVAGFHRYFQIARCFRDEASRADRQPEFTQIDIEMAFPTQDQVIELVEGMLVRVFDEALGVKIAPPFRRLTYADAMAEYGVDKPDLRFDLALADYGAAFEATEFKIFASAIAAGKRIIGFVDPGGAARSRREFDALVESALALGAKGLAWIAFADDGPRSSLPKSALTPQTLDAITRIGKAKPGDAVLLVADDLVAAQTLAGQLRLAVGTAKGLRDPKHFEFCWVLDFPLFERDSETGAITSMHHPFTAPAPGFEALEGDPLAIRAQHYDIVLNGSEIGSGSIRIHDPELQRRVFRILGYTDEQVRDRFGFLLEAFAYGAPPHGGIAPGVDRLIQMMVGADSIREVIAFPKNQRFQDLMIEAPAPVPQELLRELSLRVDAPRSDAAPKAKV